MGKELTDIPFERWVSYAFDHPVPSPGGREWFFEIDGDWWDPSRRPEVTVAYLIKLFEKAPEILISFSDAQVKQGLWFLVDNSCSDHMFVLLNKGVPWSERECCIYSIYTLFERFFVPRCSPYLSHLQTCETESTEMNPLNMICYMWWDILPIHGAEVDATCLDVMRMILNLNSVACRESALHGLGHWVYTYQQKVEATITAWLARNPRLTSELRKYALAAQKGRIL